MALVTLYHGSTKVVQAPTLEQGRPRNDYGRGFYCTQDAELGREWACFDPDKDGFLNKYQLDTDGLVIQRLDASDLTALNWMAVLLEHRRLLRVRPLQEDLRCAFVSKYRVDLGAADVVIGPRADDTYTDYARMFLQGLITDLQLEKALELGGLGLQTVLKSKKAFKRLTFMDVERVSCATYGYSRAMRDRAATEAFHELVSSGWGKEGRTINQLVGE